MNNHIKLLILLLFLFIGSIITSSSQQTTTAIDVHHIYAYRNGETTDDDNSNFHGIDAIYNALESINDNSYYNRYVIHVNGHFVFNDVEHHYKRMNKADHYNTWFVNVYGKDYVTLDGEDKNETSVEMYLDLNTDFPYWSDAIHRYYGGNYHVLFNNARWFECKNITFIGQNTRYALHQEDFNKFYPSHALFENCDFIYNSDRIWNRDNVNIPEEQSIMAGNTVLGCGYRTGGDIIYRNCIIKGGIGANTLLIGSHSGYYVSNDFEYLPANIKFEKCTLDGGDRLLGYSSMEWQVQDIFSFTDCVFNTNAYISLGVSACGINDNALSSPIAEFNNTTPLPVGRSASDGSNVLKITAENAASSKIRFDNSCSAADIFAKPDGPSEIIMTEWGAFMQSNTIFKDDEYGSDAYLLGTNSIRNNTLGKRLGDCSENNKTFSFYINDEHLYYTFTSNMTDMKNEEIITLLNQAFEGKATFTVTPLSSYFYPLFNDVVMMLNAGNKTAKRGMGVKIVPGKGFRLATAHDTINAIVIDDTQAGQYGRIALSGLFLSNDKGIGLALENGATTYGSKKCSFEISDSHDGMFVMSNFSSTDNQTLQWIDSRHVQLNKNYNLPEKEDVNADGTINVSDISSLIDIIFCKKRPITLKSANIDNNNIVNISDISALINIILDKKRD